MEKEKYNFYLPYWETNLLRHCLDVMHIEKIICDKVLYTLLDDPKKSKDNLKARKVLKEMGIRKELWPYDKGRFRPSIFLVIKSKEKNFLAKRKKMLNCLMDTQEIFQGVLNTTEYIIIKY